MRQQSPVCKISALWWRAALIRRARIRLGTCGLLVNALWLILHLPLALADGSVEAGRRLYREGLSVSGEPVAASSLGDAPAPGSQFACANCHRRSGLGSSEGNQSVPPVTAEFLFQPRDRIRKEYYAPSPNLAVNRPAYTDESLRRVLEEGIDSAGRPLKPMMPRYRLGSQDLAALTAYLKRLGTEQAPGVDGTTMHFATIIAGAVPPASGKALRDLLEAYAGLKNAGTRHEDRRVKYGPWHMESMYKAYRKWQMHVWELKGEPATWRQQLEEAYGKQPVFAVLSGVTAGPWQPVHEFCESRNLPCLFPTVDQPPASGAGYYSVYFSKGLGLEAEALATRLMENPSGPLLQVTGSRTAGTATAVAEAWRSKGGSEAVEVLELPAQQREKFWSGLAAKPAKTIMLWLGEAELKEIGALALRPEQRLVLSGTLWGAKPPQLPAKWQDRADVLYPLTLPHAQAGALRSLQAWLKSRNLVLSDPLIQANAYFAAIMASEAVTHILSYYSADYLMETIEHKLNRMLFSSLYPRLSLGTGQRFAAKGCYWIPLAKLASTEAEKSAQWIVP